MKAKLRRRSARFCPAEKATSLLIGGSKPMRPHKGINPPEAYLRMAGQEGRKC